LIKFVCNRSVIRDVVGVNDVSFAPLEQAALLTISLACSKTIYLI